MTERLSTLHLSMACSIWSRNIGHSTITCYLGKSCLQNVLFLIVLGPDVPPHHFMHLCACLYNLRRFSRKYIHALIHFQLHFMLGHLLSLCLLFPLSGPTCTFLKASSFSRSEGLGREALWLLWQEIEQGLGPGWKHRHDAFLFLNLDYEFLVVTLFIAFGYLR